MRYDCTLLKAEIARKGMNATMLAEMMKMTRGTFSNKINGRSSFNLSEIWQIQDILAMSDELRNSIFFAN